MEIKFKWAIPWIAFSQFEYEWDINGLMDFIKELEWRLDEIPEIFSLVIDPKDMTTTKRLIKANNAIKEITDKYPEVRNILIKHK